MKTAENFVFLIEFQIYLLFLEIYTDKKKHILMGYNLLILCLKDAQTSHDIAFSAGHCPDPKISSNLLFFFLIQK